MALNDESWAGGIGSVRLPGNRYLTDVEYQRLCRTAHNGLNFGHWGIVFEKVEHERHRRCVRCVTTASLQPERDHRPICRIPRTEGTRSDCPASARGRESQLPPPGAAVGEVPVADRLRRGERGLHRKRG